MRFTQDVIASKTFTVSVDEFMANYFSEAKFYNSNSNNVTELDVYATSRVNSGFMERVFSITIDGSYPENIDVNDNKSIAKFLKFHFKEKD